MRRWIGSYDSMGNGMLLKIVNSTFTIVKTFTTEDRVIITDSYMFLNNEVYNLNDITTKIGDTTMETTSTMQVVFDGFYFGISSTGYTMYKINDFSFVEKSTGTDLIYNPVVHNSHNLVSSGNNILKTFWSNPESGTIVAMKRNNVDYYRTSDANVNSNDIIQNKIAYTSNGKVTGTMPNNGSLSYNPSTSQQTIPAGYTSGGTIGAVTSSIDANIVAENIKEDVEILGVVGTFKGGVMTQEEYDECQELADLILGDTTVTDLDYVLINSVVLNDTINANVIQEEDKNILVVDDDINLPYTELEYIQSTGTQCIDTGIYSKNTIGFDIKASMTSYNAYDAFMFGGTNYADGSNDQVYLRFRPDADGGINYTIPSSTNNNNRVVYYTSMPYNTATNITFINGVATQDGENVAIDNYNVRTFTSSYTMHIFAKHDASGIGYFFTGKLYHCKLYDGQTLVRDLIPVKRKGDNNICLYDKVSETFFTNEGTGVFIAGPEKEVE